MQQKGSEEDGSKQLSTSSPKRSRSRKRFQLGRAISTRFGGNSSIGSGSWGTAGMKRSNSKKSVVSWDASAVSLEEFPPVPNQPRQQATHNGDDDDASSYLSDEENSEGLYAPEQSSRKTTDEESKDRSGSDRKAMEGYKPSRIIFGIVAILVVTAIVLGSLLYTMADNHDTDAYEAAFQNAAIDLIDACVEQSASLASILHSISITMTLSAGRDAPWPLYTMNNLAVVAEDFLAFDPSVQLVYSPIVHDGDNNNSQRAAWQHYSVAHQNQVITPTYPYQITEYIYSRYNFTGNVLFPDQEGTGPYSPVWQVHPLPNDYESIRLVNFNMLSDPKMAKLLQAAQEGKTHIFSELGDDKELFGIVQTGSDVYKEQRPQSLFVEQVHDHLVVVGGNESKVVGHVFATVPWDLYFENVILPDNTDTSVYCVIQNSCGPTAYTYQVDHTGVTYVGKGDLHSGQHEHPNQQVELFHYGATSDENGDPWQCHLELAIYPTAEMQWSFDTGTPVYYFMIVAIVFVLIGVAVASHHRISEANKREMHLKSQRSKAIIASLFPDQIREKLFDLEGEVCMDKMRLLNRDAAKSIRLDHNPLRSSLLIWGGEEDDPESQQNVAAELYLECTVCISEICGFTAWSSSRQPKEVFTLLETIFRAFDKIAKNRGAFKAETVGDQYVAVAGLPKAREDHAIVMARFARDAMETFIEHIKMLEVSLGPDTSELGIRFGLHSGPITAGVLRGERARFQLFGDTVIACRAIESNGGKDRIHISKETAELIKAGGMNTWVKPRHQRKGRKEAKETYWLLPKGPGRRFATVAVNSIATSAELAEESAPERRDSTFSTVSKRESSEYLKPAARRQDHTKEDRLERLIFWNSESLLLVLRQIVARRNASANTSDSSMTHPEVLTGLEEDFVDNKVVVKEIREVIELPRYNAVNQVDPSTVDLGERAESQLRDYVTLIASFYRNNPFHNFQHASHVTQSTKKLLSRIVAPKLEMEDGDMDAKIHDYTYGITSDPLTQFAALLSALIHDVDHRGVSNGRLAVEQKAMATMFDHKSIAEQNSLDIAWESLMDPRFRDLRNCIYTNEAELRRFRALLVNCVMSTDIFDKELSALRKARWDKAFQIPDDLANREDINRKATIVIEHLIQASDVSHCMQHWLVYTKWNERLFHELYLAYTEGRMDSDPSDGWYKGEIWFFDNYVIPLTKKLRNCGVFGVSSDEYLNYALTNRAEWEARGEEIVKGMVQKYSKQYREKGGKSASSDDMEQEEEEAGGVEMVEVENVEEPSEYFEDEGDELVVEESSEGDKTSNTQKTTSTQRTTVSTIEC
ncbi:Receptor-type guanylate cyclase gcy [Seminavis robusta]|uniref:Receptor-type guanylate cyclase gcy n=1 Tax=Seminavis robusta TaxID=568900 RepID=A0A9N8HD92_9STRA|nr:Receptor-type guanylate cyclase gcy [Seminavis robusta]|eukprot:Sro250_g099000.1 Receptor-type guanylate cyclase gcy (1320) ;mRNA; f:33340-38778